jgi:hypothetical protein
VGASTGLLVGALTLPGLRNLLGLAAPTPFGWALVGGSALAAVAVNRLLAGIAAVSAAERPDRESTGNERQVAAMTLGDAASVGTP